MKFKKNVFVLLLIFISYFLSSSEYNIKGLNKDLSDRLTGIWVKDISKAKYNEKHSWGFSKTTLNNYLDIDFKGKFAPFLDSESDMGYLEIISIKEIEKNKYTIKLNLSEEGFSDKESSIEITFLDNKKIEVKNNNAFLQKGIFYKAGGLDIEFNDYQTSTVDNLRLRDKPKLDAGMIRFLKKGEKLVVLTSLEKETEINGVKGTWVNVVTEQGEVGWCFDAYLKEWKNDTKKN